MRKDYFKPGDEWAYRASRTIGAPASRVELLAIPTRKGTAKVKVRHLDGELEGLEEFVHAQHLRCPWKQWRKVERDERNEAIFLDRMDQEPDSRVLWEAASAVLLSTGEDLMLDEHRTYTRVYQSQVPALERVADRARVQVRSWESEPCFKTRSGDVYMPNRLLVDLAEAFAKAESETVRLYLDTEERGLLAEGFTYGELYPHRDMLARKPAWTIARVWTGQDGGRDYLEEEVKRLRDLLRKAITALHHAGETRTADRIRRSLDGK